MIFIKLMDSILNPNKPKYKIISEMKLLTKIEIV